MNTIVATILQVSRTSRGPLTAGALIVAAIWIQLADQLSRDWPGRLFGGQIVDALTSLPGFGIATVFLLLTGVAGSVSTRVSRLLFEPGMRGIVTRWQERCAVRRHMRSNRWSAFDVGGSEYNIADAQVTHDRRFVSNAINWLIDWKPGKSAYVEYHVVNFWLEPKWGGRVIGWAAEEVYRKVHGDQRQVPFEDMRSRLARNDNLRHLVVSLERELERNPSAPFIGEDDTNVLERLTAVISENEYRLAVMPALAALFVSIGLAWWYWAFAFIPITALVYGSSLAKQDDVPRSALGWLLDGRGSSYALDEIRLCAEREAETING